MKVARFTQYNVFFKLFLTIIGWAPLVAYWGYFIYLCVTGSSMLTDSQMLVPYIVLGIMLVAMYVLAYVFVAPEVLGILHVYEDGKIVWKMPFFKCVTINVNEQVQVTVARGQGRQIMANEIELLRYCQYICFSTNSIPTKYRNKINSLRCKKDFIRFPYTDQLCLTLIKTLPIDTTVQLKKFYDYIKNEEIRIRTPKL